MIAIQNLKSIVAIFWFNNCILGGFWVWEFTFTSFCLEKWHKQKKIPISKVHQLQTLTQTILLLWYHYFHIFLGIFSLHTQTFFLKSYFTKTQEEGATCCWRNWRTKGTKWSHRRRTIFCVLTSVRPIVGDIHTGLYEMKSKKFQFSY